MRLDLTFLYSGFFLSIALGLATFYTSHSVVYSIAVFLLVFVAARLLVYSVFERFLSFKRMREFMDEHLFFKCARCASCCRLRVNLDKKDLEQIVNYARKKGIQQTIIDKRGKDHWLRRTNGNCVFLTQLSDGTLGCKIYDIRPLACRLYPLIPSKDRLKVDINCKGLNKEGGLTYKEYVRSQGVSSYIKSHLRE